MKSKLNLDPKIIDSARSCAAGIAADMQKLLTGIPLSAQRTVVRLPESMRG